LSRQIAGYDERVFGSFTRISVVHNGAHHNREVIANGLAAASVRRIPPSHIRRKGPLTVDFESCTEWLGDKKEHINISVFIE